LITRPVFISSLGVSQQNCLYDPLLVIIIVIVVVVLFHGCDGTPNSTHKFVDNGLCGFGQFVNSTLFVGNLLKCLQGIQVFLQRNPAKGFQRTIANGTRKRFIP
jgi:hypothetical protein